MKARKAPHEADDIYKSNESSIIHKPVMKVQTTITAPPIMPANQAVSDYDWDVIDEYDPLWPNEYEKLVKERREKASERNRDRDRDRKRHPGSYSSNSPPTKYPGFGGRSDEAEGYRTPPPSQGRSGGVAIAPPPSLQESTPVILPQNPNITVPYGSSSVAAKIMARYGFKDGQGLGKQEQGMAMALQVEKTSKRGGRIIHEKETMLPPVNPAPVAQSQSPAPKEEPSITEIMKAPSKVVLLRVS